MGFVLSLKKKMPSMRRREHYETASVLSLFCIRFLSFDVFALCHIKAFLMGEALRSLAKALTAN